MEQELKCKSCNRHLGWSYGSIVAELKCANSSCRATSQFKVVSNNNIDDIRFKFAKPEQQPKKKEVEVS